VLADHRPLVEILGRVDAVVFDLGEVFDGDAETEEGLAAGFHEGGDEAVGEDEVVGGGVSGVGVEVAEDVGDVDVEVAAEHAADVVEAGVRDAGLLEVGEHGVVDAL